MKESTKKSIKQNLIGIAIIVAFFAYSNWVGDTEYNRGYHDAARHYDEMGSWYCGKIVEAWTENTIHELKEILPDYYYQMYWAGYNDRDEKRGEQAYWDTAEINEIPFFMREYSKADYERLFDAANEFAHEHWQKIEW